MDTTEQNLLRAVCADRADDTVRTAYADWLDEQPDAYRECPNCTDRQALMQTPYAYEKVTRYWHPAGREKCPACDNTRVVPDDALKRRAEFIRVQIAQFADPDAYWADAAMKRGIDVIQGTPPGSTYPRRVLWGWPDLYASGSANWTFSRGFVGVLKCNAADWLRYADQVYWSPKQKAKCWQCDGYGTVLGAGPDRGNPTCDRCDGEKVVPRPFNPTCQPLTRVTVTGTLYLLGERTDRGDDDLWLAAERPPFANDGGVPCSPKVRADDVAAATRRVGTTNWVEAVCALLWPDLSFTLS